MKFDDSVPIYLQIKEEIENAIITNSLKEEEPIPSIRSLAAQYRLNPQTVSNAVSELMNEGVIFKKRGIGMFVEKGAKAKLTKKKNQEFRNDDLIKLVHKSKSLGITKQELIESIASVYEQGGNK
ncbi:MAG: GntR family transcriptional regulator [Candidatus Cloacimonetes bacterium]|nr:GntR family transcriptional regulator [Candidatus Cloacimonadota bacterium]MCF7814904.1 GntR family transcriptional regulator [Candidatus Cloacimonadota bacterium]MCF7869301.1 GntR family transcriptional regulator [Candidatus Cloacimonadota bacterium]MCF7884619.1 GntR family transcriptional regulator [Candidatus Cloacimonadota bacterium]